MVEVEKHDFGTHHHVQRAFVEHSGLVARIACRLLGRQDEVNDVVQDVFVAALSAGPELNSTRPMAGWLATVTVRSVGKRIRRRRLRRSLGLDADCSYDNIAASAADSETRVMARRAFRALDELPSDLRSPWSLRYLDGEPLDLVAARCDCSLSTAKRRISKAQARLLRVVGGR